MSTLELPVAAPAAPPGDERFATARRLIRRPGAALGLGTLLVLVVSSALAPWIAPYDPNAQALLDRFQGPSADHWFGTDQLGRDLFSRVLYGGRLALGIAAAATAVALVLGAAWGGASAVRGGRVDEVLMRIADTLMAIPLMLLALIFVAAFGASVASLAVILGLLHAPVTARMTRIGVLSELHADYCVAARSFGMSKARLLLSEVMPNVAPVLLVQASLNAASVILTEAALSFVGLGVQPPDGSWGTLLLQGYSKIYSSYWLVIFPGVAIFLAILALNTVADHLQAVLDPRRRA